MEERKKLQRQRKRRHAPSYSSNSQGSVERLHRTLLGQVRVVKAQVESNYSMTMSTKHCLRPWKVRRAAWTVNRYVIHSDGYTSFESRWGRNYERAICEFGETLLYLPPQHKKLPKADLRMQKCICSEKFPKPEKSTSQRKQAYKKYELYGDYNRTSNTTLHC